MELEHYISNGFIEKHLLGFATPEEEEELKIQLSIFPELAVEMDEVQRRIEKAAFMNAPLPPAHIKTALMQKIALEAETPETGLAFPERHVNYREPGMPQNHMTVHIGWKILLIALLSLIALSLLAGIFFYMATAGH